MSPAIPDAEALVAGWLRDDVSIEAMDARVASETPKTMQRPWIRVTQLDATDDARSSIEHLLTFMVQLDCYAGEIATTAHAAPAEASLLARRARAVLKDTCGQVLDGVVVSQVRFTGHLRLPDTTMEPARQRVIVTAEVTLHAI